MKKYMQIYNYMKDDIVKGVYRRGQKLLSKREAADTFGMSVISVTHAYELLEEEGYIEPRQRSGYIVTYDRSITDDSDFLPLEEQRLSTPVINSSRDDYALSPALYARTARKVLSIYEESVLEPAPGFGSLMLREAISAYLQRRMHLTALPEQVIIGSGAEYLYGLIVKALGHHLIYGIESPSYEKIELVYRAEGINIEYLPLGRNGIQSNALRNTPAQVLHVTPYRSFPSGVTATAAKRHEYLRWIEEHQGIIIEDDFESEFSPSRKAVESLFVTDTHGGVIYVNTFSKTIGSAVRMAYMVLPPKLLPLFQERIGFYSCPVPTYQQLIVAELIKSGDFDRHLNKVRRNLRRSMLV